MTPVLANNDVDSVPKISDYVSTCLTAYDLHFCLDCSFEFSCGLWGVLIGPVFNPFPNKPWFLHVCSISLLKTLWKKGEIARNEQFLFFPQCFLPV